MRRPYVLLLAVALAGCGHGSAPKFTKLPSGAATAPATAPSAPADGSSTMRLSGEVEMAVAQDFQCSYATDDFFVRGQFGDYQGIPMYLAINVEFYKKPGRYDGRTQILLRRVAPATGADSFYASWAESKATATVLAKGKGLDLTATVLPPEAGTDSTRPVTISGHLGCLPG
jgi:hypothetical protein